MEVVPPRGPREHCKVTSNQEPRGEAGACRAPSARESPAMRLYALGGRSGGSRGALGRRSVSYTHLRAHETSAHP
eukprot:14818677-Alexandrium_andersonii.AAC.1